MAWRTLSEGSTGAVAASGGTAVGSYSDAIGAKATALGNAFARRQGSLCELDGATRNRQVSFRYNVPWIA